MDMSQIKHVLLDIEGTILPISWVHDVLFPYALKALPSELDAYFANSSSRLQLQNILSNFPEEVRGDKEELVAHIETLTAVNDKGPALKQLQGYLWQRGFDETGELRAPVWRDVPEALIRQKKAGRDIYVYSSGSLLAQRLVFGHVEPAPSYQSDVGDLTSLVSGYFDPTTAGPKLESQSYERIVSHVASESSSDQKSNRQSEPQQWLFLSDNILGRSLPQDGPYDEQELTCEELRAARKTGMQVALAVREGNPAVKEPWVYGPDGEKENVRIIEDFSVLK